MTSDSKRSHDSDHGASGGNHHQHNSPRSRKDDRSRSDRGRNGGDLDVERINKPNHLSHHQRDSSSSSSVTRRHHHKSPLESEESPSIERKHRKVSIVVHYSQIVFYLPLRV